VRAALTTLAVTSWTGVAGAQNGPTQQTNEFSHAYLEGVQIRVDRLGRAARDGRGFWRAIAFIAYKRRGGAEVVYREKVSSGKLGDCHPVPPAS
jgi:hypothetical protein